MVLNQHIKAIERLKAIINDLKEQALTIDFANSNLKSHKKIEDSALFSTNVFQTRSDKIVNYVNETERKVRELQKHIAMQNTSVIENLISTIERQIASLTNAISANDAIHQNIEKTQKKRFVNKSKYQKAAQAMLQPTHELYQKLSEHHEFERRLALMIAEREHLRSNTQNKSVKNEKLTAEVLALHQRLGRCRHAISIIERDIELAEKRAIPSSKS